IYQRGYVLGSEPGIKRLLREYTLVPTLNVFSHLLKEFNFDIFLTLVVNIMHEFELGVWKALLTHLVRIMHSCGATTVQEFNHRFRQISSFGASTICRFTHNVADMKKLAAWDFEDILQVGLVCIVLSIHTGHLPVLHSLLQRATACV
ncbi:hypothetical protein EDB87DRAFT_1571188, partial [Lactarius vividus]